jgi:transcriptional regulator with XRE-family HTH domain
MTTVGREIRKARIDKGINQKALADKLDVKQQYLSRIEHDMVDLRVSLLQKIAHMLAVPVARLVPELEPVGEDAPEPPQPVAAKAARQGSARSTRCPRTPAKVAEP